MSQTRARVVRLGVPLPDPEREEQLLTAVGAELAMYQPKSPADMLAAVREADVVLNAMGFPFTEEVFAQIPRCRAVIQTSVGYDKIDVAAATAHRIMVANLPDYCTEEVSDHAVALLLTLARRIPQMQQFIRQGDWGKPGLRAMDVVGRVDRLRERTLAIVGFGNIGRLVARKTRGLFGRLITADPYVKPEIAAEHGVELLPLEDVLRQADYVTLHVLLTDATRHLINEERLGWMKPTAILVNTCRGPVVEETALVAALHAGKLAAAGLDVFETEPIGADHPLANLDNVIVTPHLAVYSYTAMEHWRTDPFDDAARILKGQYPRGMVNRELKAVLGLQEPG